jgi:hypothetical protein
VAAFWQNVQTAILRVQEEAALLITLAHVTHFFHTSVEQNGLVDGLLLFLRKGNGR